MRTRLLLLALTLSSSAYAQKIVVRQLKGHQAVVDVIEGEVDEGEEYELTSPDPSTTTTTTTSSAPAATAASSTANVSATTSPPRNDTGDRSRIVGLGFNLSSLNTSAPYGNSTMNSIGVNGRYGWNAERFEYGFAAGIQVTDKGTGSSTTFTGGLFGDWNWVPNQAGENFVYGLGVSAQYGATNLPGGNGTTTTFVGYPAFFGKWFFLGNSTAFRMDVGYSYSDDSSTGQDLKITGLNAQGGLSVYF